jgi:hypothetical protein
MAGNCSYQQATSSVNAPSYAPADPAASCARRQVPPGEGEGAVVIAEHEIFAEGVPGFVDHRDEGHRGGAVAPARRGKAKQMVNGGIASKKDPTRLAGLL